MSDVKFSVLKKLSKVLVGKNIGKRVPFAKSAFYKIFSRVSPKIVEVNGMKMMLNPEDRIISRDILLTGVHERFITEFVKEKITRGMTVVDLGANIGYYTLIFSKLVGPEGKVYAFEPEPTNFQILGENVRMNGLQNVALVNKAASDSAGISDLYLSEHNKGGHSMFNFNKETKSVKIETVSMDDFFRDAGDNLDFIKIDVEGAEYKVLKGMKDILRRNRKMKILTEILPKAIEEAGDKPEKMLTELTEEGFEINLLDETRGLVTQVNIDKDMEEILSVKGVQKNLFCERRI